MKQAFLAAFALAACSTEPSTTITQVPLTLELSLATGVGSGSAGSGSAVTVLQVTALDGTTPVITDLWLYTLDDTGAMAPLTGFTSDQARKAPSLMLPAMIAGQPSGLSPADDGRQNGVMTGVNRGTLAQGQFVSTVTGTVHVALPATPTSPILVVSGVEDERYSGAAAIAPDGTPATVPAGVGAPQTFPRVAFAEVQAILSQQCAQCHVPTGPDNAGFYLVTGSRDDLVNNNFAFAEQTLDCETANPGSGSAYDACIQAITQAQFLVEPGAPAVSDLLQRSRPDEDAGTSPEGLLWYGSHGSRYNATYGDRRMPSTTQSTDASDWTNAPTPLDMAAPDYQAIWSWVAQGAPE